MLSRLLFVSQSLLLRGWPFFLLYLLLFAALTLADGLSLTLFVQRVGVAALPFWQALSALAVLGAVGGYLVCVDQAPPGRLFTVILAGPILLFGVVWGSIAWLNASGHWLGLLFVGRELAFALVLLHFGTFLQHYFTRSELARVMPVIYAGGRVGGIAGGAMLQHLSRVVDPVNLLLAAAGLLAASIVGVAWIQSRLAPVVPAEGPDRAAAAPPDEALAVQSFPQFMRFVVSNGLMFWISVTTVAYFCCRTFLNFRYSRCFEATFATDVEMAEFLGRYAQYALTVSLLLQLLVINRWIARFGLPCAHMTYALLLLTATVLGGLEMTLATAVFARFVEGELRYGLRNPTAQMILNQFSRALRIRARAWSMGLLIPLSTCAASLALAALLRGGWSHWIGLWTMSLGLTYLAASLPLIRHCGVASSPPSMTAAQPSPAATTCSATRRVA